MKIILEKLNEVYFRVHCDISQALELKSFVSCYVKNYKWHPKFKSRMWDGKVSFFNIQDRTLPIGLLKNFVEFCKEFGYSYEFKFEKDELYSNITREYVEEFAKELLDGTVFVPRDYQIEAVYKSLKYKRGIVLACTGSGKSLTIYIMIRLLLMADPDIKILLIVPNISLVNQMYSDFAEYGWNDLDLNVTRLYSEIKSEFDKKKNVVISTYQSMVKKNSTFMEQYNTFILDEAHTGTSMSVKSIANKMVNAEYRIGLTGTLPTGKDDKYNIYGSVGYPLCELKAKELIDLGVLSKIKIANVQLMYPDDIVKKNRTRPYVEEVKTTIEYKKRNKVFDFIIQNSKPKENILILCHRIEHLKDVVFYLNNKFGNTYKIYEIYSKTKPEERERIRKSIDKEDNVILVSTFATTSTGLNIKKLHHVVFAASYKAKIKILQSIGRGLRTHKTKLQIIIWDIVDNLCWRKRTGTIGKNHLFLHWEERMKYYKEQEFKCLHTKLNI